MKRTSANFLVDSVALAALVLLAATGALIRYVLPAGSGHTSALWGLDRHEWGHIHFWIAVVFGVATVVHLVLHWGWITCVVRGDSEEKSKGRVIAALAVLLALVVLAAAPFLGTVEEIEDGRRGGRAGEHEGRAGAHEGEPAQHEAENETVHGSMTLRDVQELTGVPVDYMIANLSLPVDVSPDERLGRLRRSYAFEIDDVRRVVSGYGSQDRGRTEDGS
ncbi:MAG: DUF4405 domain-containing protein [Candidatus Eisenbacteria bacterium]